MFNFKAANDTSNKFFSKPKNNAVNDLKFKFRAVITNTGGGDIMVRYVESSSSGLKKSVLFLRWQMEIKGKIYSKVDG